MPIIKSAKKRAKQSDVRRERNSARKDEYKNLMRQIKKDAAAGKDCGELLRKFQSSVDHATKHNIIHKNKAARLVHQAVTIARSSKGAKPPAKAAKKPAAKKTPVKKAPAKKPAAKKPATKKSADKAE